MVAIARHWEHHGRDLVHQLPPVSLSACFYIAISVLFSGFLSKISAQLVNVPNTDPTIAKVMMPMFFSHTHTGMATPFAGHRTSKSNMQGTTKAKKGVVMDPVKATNKSNRGKAAARPKQTRTNENLTSVRGKPHHKTKLY